MENWLDKYKPKILKEVIGAEDYISQMIKHVNQFNTKNIDKILKPNIIITGTNGIGKSLIVDLVLKEYGFEKISADLTNVSVTKKSKRKKKNDKEIIGSNRSVKTYYISLKSTSKLMCTTIGTSTKNKVALVFDNVSNISNPKEKEAIKEIVKINNKHKLYPIFIIASNKHNKTINDLKKIAAYPPISDNNGEKKKKKEKKITNEILMRPPSYNNIEKFVKQICLNEQIKIITKKTDEYCIYELLIEHSQYDIRRLLNTLEELKLINEKSPITLSKFLQYCETSKKKDLDPGIYEATGLLLNNYKDIDTALHLYSEDRATIPLMVHENYPINIKYQYPKLDAESKLDMIFNISKSISESDKIDGLIYSNQCWSLQSVHGFYSCVMPSYYINTFPGKLCVKVKYEYTKDYNKTSIKKINNKVIKNAQSHQSLKKACIYDFLYMASILKTLLDNKDYDKVVELMKPYNLKLKEIESIIKIDKIKKNNKVTLTSKQKTHLKELLGVDE